MQPRGVSVRNEKLNKYFGNNHVLKDIDLDVLAGKLPKLSKGVEHVWF